MNMRRRFFFGLLCIGGPSALNENLLPTLFKPKVVRMRDLYNLARIAFKKIMGRDVHSSADLCERVSQLIVVDYAASCQVIIKGDDPLEIWLVKNRNGEWHAQTATKPTECPEIFY